MFFLHDIIKAVTEHYAPEKSIVKRHMELGCRLNMLNCPSELNVSGSHTTSLLFIPRSLLPVFNLNVQHAVITAFTPALIVKKNAYPYKLSLDSSSRSNCQSGCFCSNYAKYIIFTLSCCHKHFGLRLDTEHLVCSARQCYSHRWMQMSVVQSPEIWRSCAAPDVAFCVGKTVMLNCNKTLGSMWQRVSSAVLCWTQRFFLRAIDRQLLQRYQ